MPPKEGEMHQEIIEPEVEARTYDDEEIAESEVMDVETTNTILYDSEQEDIADVIDDTPVPNLEPIGPPQEETPNMSEEEIEHLVDETIRDVFKEGLDPQFILQSQCPICGFRRKKALEMVVRKGGIVKRLLSDDDLTNPVVGITTACQNCGHIDIFGTDIRNILYYLRGKGDKCRV